jgi:hypothetical protein
MIQLKCITDRLISLCITSALLLTLTACAIGDRIVEIHQGMSKEEVLATLGNPDGAERSGNYEALRYTKRVQSGWWWWNRDDYNVILRNGRAVQYGPGKVQQQNDTLILVPLLP